MSYFTIIAAAAQGINIMDLVSNLAFPIAMCVALFWKMNQQDKDHKEESLKFAQAIENNTEALVELTEVIRSMNNK